MERRLNRGLDACVRPLIESAKVAQTGRGWFLFSGYSYAKGDADVYLTYRFTGIMPDRTRQIAREAQAEFGQNLFLVCDAQGSWVRTDKAPSEMVFAKRDPLLIGVKVVASQMQLFLLDKFDVTLAEDYLTKEFVK